MKKILTPIMLLSLVACSSQNTEEANLTNKESDSVKSVNMREGLKEGDYTRIKTYRSKECTIPESYHDHNDNTRIIRDTTERGFVLEMPAHEASWGDKLEANISNCVFQGTDRFSCTSQVEPESINSLYKLFKLDAVETSTYTFNGQWDKSDKLITKWTQKLTCEGPDCDEAFKLLPREGSHPCEGTGIDLLIYNQPIK